MFSNRDSAKYANHSARVKTDFVTFFLIALLQIIMTLHCDTMIPSSRRTRKESLLVVATLSLASLCCVVCAEGPSASGAGHEHFLQEFSDFEDDEDTAFDMISTESELPDVTSLGLHDIQHRFQTLVHGVDDEEEDDAKDRSGASAGGERGLKP